MQPILTVEHLSKSFTTGTDHIQVLRDVSFSLFPGEIVALIGESGAGKSTLLHLLAGLEPPDSGRITFFLPSGTSYAMEQGTEDSHAAFRARNIGFVFQYHHLLTDFNALENVLLPALLLGTPMATARQRAMELLELVGVAHRARHFPTQLSGGEQQRVALARALMNTPLVVFADEPTGNLDHENAEKIVALIQDLKQQLKRTFLIASHSQFIAQHADRILQIHDGIVEEL